MPSNSIVPPAQFLFLLIHGTWATGAPWTQKNSALAQRLTTAFPSARVEAFEWSGSNTFAARRSAATALHDRIMKETSEASSQFKIVLIGHSHGGSTIAYVLRENPDLSQHIAGAIYLSTPFMSLALRPGYKIIFFAFLASLGTLALEAGLFNLGRALFAIGQGWHGSDLWWPVCIALLLLMTVAQVFRLYRGRKETLECVREIPVKLQQKETAHLSSHPSLFLRSTGDEVALFFGLAQVLGFISGRSGLLLARISTNTLILLAAAWRAWWGKFVLSVLALVFGITLLAAGATSETFGPGSISWPDILNPWSTSWSLELFDGQPGWIEGLFRMLLSLDILMVSFLTIVSLAFGLLSLFTFLIAIVTYWAFGEFDILRAPFLDFAAEPVPVGIHEFVHVDWSNDGEVTRELRHSSPYGSATALDEIMNWIAGRISLSTVSRIRMGKEPVNDPERELGG